MQTAASFSELHCADQDLSGQAGSRVGTWPGQQDAQCGHGWCMGRRHSRRSGGGEQQRTRRAAGTPTLNPYIRVSPAMAALALCCNPRLSQTRPARQSGFSSRPQRRLAPLLAYDPDTALAAVATAAGLGVWGTLATLVKASGKVDGRLGAVEGRLGGVEGRLGAVEGRLSNVEGKLDSLTHDMGEVKGMLNSLNTNVATLTATLAAPAAPAPAPAPAAAAVELAAAAAVQALAQALKQALEQASAANNVQQDPRIPPKVRSNGQAGMCCGTACINSGGSIEQPCCAACLLQQPGQHVAWFVLLQAVEFSACAAGLFPHAGASVPSCQQRQRRLTEKHVCIVARTPAATPALWLHLCMQADAGQSCINFLLWLLPFMYLCTFLYPTCVVRSFHACSSAPCTAFEGFCSCHCMSTTCPVAPMPPTMRPTPKLELACSPQNMSHFTRERRITAVARSSGQWVERWLDYRETINTRGGGS